MRGEGRGVPRVGWRGGSGVLPTPLGGDVCSGHVQYPAFAPGSLKVAVGFGFPFSGLFLSFVQNLSQLHMHAVIFSPIQFLCILLLQKRRVQVQALKQRIPGPSLSQHRHMKSVSGFYFL